MLRISLLILAVLFLIPQQSIAATRKHTVCSPNICQPRKDIPKQFRALIPRTEGLISEKPIVSAKNFFANNLGTPLPQILVPANREITSACHQNQKGTLICIEEVRYTGCPKDISMTVQTPNGPRLADCDLLCEPDVPDPGTGLCDCEPVSCVIQSTN